mmetsp:Transcript_37979/g.91320  ORF Transcript_37979/g.91320 Transcript_37979/m.91320 type:complete len:269 (-) Transcript_37979:263-1069(-)
MKRGASEVYVQRLVRVGPAEHEVAAAAGRHVAGGEDGPEQGVHGGVVEELRPWPDVHHVHEARGSAVAVPPRPSVPHALRISLQHALRQLLRSRSEGADGIHAQCPQHCHEAQRGKSLSCFLRPSLGPRGVQQRHALGHANSCWSSSGPPQGAPVALARQRDLRMQAFGVGGAEAVPADGGGLCPQAVSPGEAVLQKAPAAGRARTGRVDVVSPVGTLFVCLAEVPAGDSRRCGLDRQIVTWRVFPPSVAFGRRPLHATRGVCPEGGV